jgi:RNA polymerase sigma-70 factor, ECF subfamily
MLAGNSADAPGAYQLQAAIAALHAIAPCADLLRRAGRTPEALDAYDEAIALAPTDAERLFLRRRASLAP